MIFEEPTVEYIELDMIETESSSSQGGGLDTCRGIDGDIHQGEVCPEPNGFFNH